MNTEAKLEFSESGHQYFFWGRGVDIPEWNNNKKGEVK
jgi:hypothetical protein